MLDKGLVKTIIVSREEGQCPSPLLSEWDSACVIDKVDAVALHERVRSSGRFNFQGCRIPVPSRLNTTFWRSNLLDYPDKIVCDMLEFGWPLGYKASELPASAMINHKGAREFEAEIDGYISRELSLGGTLGPFMNNPFTTPLAIAPLNSVPKRDSKDRRVILDLSFPHGLAVNDGISKNLYLGEDIELVYPSVDSFASLVRKKGKGCLMYKRDLKRAYRQFPVDPGDYHLLGFSWRGLFFVDRVLAMGLRSAAMMCQRTTSAIRYLHLKAGFDVEVYLDDFGGCEKEDQAPAAYFALGKLLEDAGLEESKDKALYPATRMPFLGVMFDSVTQTLEVTPERLDEITQLLQAWLSRSSASKQDLQSLIGKLIFVAKCVQPGRLFISRLLEQLRKLKAGHHRFRLTAEFRKDLNWWLSFVHQYNGVSIFLEEVWSRPDELLATDACLSGCGGLCREEAFTSEFPEHIINLQLHINALELLAVIVGVKTWGPSLRGKRLRIYCDNQATVAVINSGRSRDQYMLKCMRELTFYCAKYECMVRAVHLPGVENRLADCLSRWHLNRSYREEFRLRGGVNVTLVSVPTNAYIFNSGF